MVWWNPRSWATAPLAQPARQEPSLRLPSRRGSNLEARAFNGAVMDALTADLPAILQSGNASLRPALRTLRSRSRQLAENNDYAREFFRHLTRKVLGPEGLRLIVQAKNPDGTVDDQDSGLLRSAFEEWGKRGSCTVCGRYSWKEVQRLVLTTMARDGEVLVRIVKGWSGNKFRFALQVIEVDVLDENLNFARGGSSGGVPVQGDNEVRMGVERDAWGRVVAYHMRTINPYDDVSTWQGGSRWQRIPAEEMLHLFVPDRADDARGAPWMWTAIRRLQMIGGYEEAELVAARLGAAKGGFFTEEADELDGTGDGQDASGNIVDEVQPGQFQRLPKGVDFKPYDPQHPNSNFPTFIKAMLRGAAAGMGITYNGWARDLEGVNFGSLRQGELDERDMWRVMQGFLAEHLCDGVWQAWLDMGLLTGALANPNGSPLPPSKRDKFDAATWRGRGWPWIDPAKDIAAESEAVGLGIRSRTQICAERGVDIEDVFREIKAENEMAKKYGVVLVVNPPKPPPGTLPPVEDGGAEPPHGKKENSNGD